MDRADTLKDYHSAFAPSETESKQLRSFYEFFAGGGMARMGLGPKWKCLFANDFDAKKGAVYERNWGQGALKVGDIRGLETSDLPDQANLVWASFPCQDLSLAGSGAGLKGERSGTFWPFWNLIEALSVEDREPNIVVLENVCGTLTSHGGGDFAAICSALHRSGYRYGAVTMDAAHFVPQSRPRLFVIAVRADVELPPGIDVGWQSPTWHPPALRKAYEQLDASLQERWIWWSIPTPPMRNARLADLIENEPKSVRWHRQEETHQLLSMMSQVNLQKVADAKQAGRRMVGTVYKRTRRDENGLKVQRAEVRFDDVAGCLRTPAGGSSRQLILVVDGDDVKSRLISSRETARLMGLPDEYELPLNYNEAYHLTGDGVAVPVVRYLAHHVFEPILDFTGNSSRRAA
jgi:DNA (cytosine-5)-methyltransferase 1